MESRIEEVSTEPRNSQDLQAKREELGRRIDAGTAEVKFCRCYISDPYGDGLDYLRNFAKSSLYTLPALLV